MTDAHPSLDCRLIRSPVDWLQRFDERCYFYPGRDCPGWDPGGVCSRFEDPIPADADPA